MTTKPTISFINEVWKEINFGEGFTNTRRLMVSNFGRICSCTPGAQDYRLLQGSRQGGYAIVRFKLLKPRAATIQNILDKLVYKKNSLANTIIRQQEKLAMEATTTEKALLKTAIAENEKKLAALKKSYIKTYKKTEKERLINMGLLVHRLVAEFFLQNKRAEQTLVIHKDYNKLNNHYSNLQWATMDENIAHQQHSPFVIAERKLRPAKKSSSKASKLTITRVMLIKKRLLENTPMHKLAKQFKVTETQIARIKKGENWKEVAAAT